MAVIRSATNHTLSFIKAAQAGMARTWREAPGARPWRYSKAGVVTTDLKVLEDAPRALIGQLDRERSAPLMAAMDACNARFGRGSVVPVRAELTEKRTWSMKFEMRTPHYTTQISELPIALAE
jgi:DNA polymerase V